MFKEFVSLKQLRFRFLSLDKYSPSMVVYLLCIVPLLCLFVSL